jgi:hypothetical protein
MQITYEFGTGPAYEVISNQQTKYYEDIQRDKETNFSR